MKYLSFALILLFSFTACIGKKKHYATLTSQEMKMDALRRGQIQKVRRELNSVRDSLRRYEIETATKTGSISTLETLRLEMDRKNKELEEKLENLNLQSSSQQKNLDKEITGKEAEITQLKSKIASIRSLIDAQQVELGTLTGDLREKMLPYPPNKFEIISSRASMSLDINEELLFQKSSVSKLSDDGIILIQNVANLLNNYPAVNIEVIGHTDDGKPRTGYKDNWMISTVRSVGVINVLTENGVTPNQITAAGKGEYAPKKSNSSPEGQSENRRIEIRFTPAQQVLAQKIKQVIE